MADLILRGGMIADIQTYKTADVAITDGKISGMASSISDSAPVEIDARGLHILPGGIDPHVHFNEPGRAEWEGFATGTRALAAGGMTTCFDMPLNSTPPTTTADAFDAKMRAVRESAVVNVYLWGGLIPGNLGELEALHRRGVIGFKAFMSNSGIEDFPAVDDHTLLEGMRIAAGLGQIVAVHAENDAITGGRAREAVRAGKTSARDYLASRPVVAELEAIQRAILLAGETNCKLHIVHVSSGRGVELVLDAQRQGVDVSCETCPHYLVLTEQDVERIGAAAKCAPPPRNNIERDHLWSLVLGDRLPMIASDHSPSPLEMKQGEDFFAIWGGIAGCQSTLALMLTEGHHRRGMPLPQISAVTSYNAAQRFGLPNKGRVAVGYDADLALVDVDAEYVLNAEDLRYRHKISPYVGMTLRGHVKHTIVGGKIVHEDQHG